MVHTAASTHPIPKNTAPRLGCLFLPSSLFQMCKVLSLPDLPPLVPADGSHLGLWVACSPCVPTVLGPPHHPISTPAQKGPSGIRKYQPSPPHSSCLLTLPFLLPLPNSLASPGLLKRSCGDRGE